MSGKAVVILLGCIALASAKRVKSGYQVVSGKRDLYSLDDSSLQPPPYLTSLLNQVLDVKGGGHLNYMNVYPHSWTTDQVNSELKAEVQFTAYANRQTVNCQAHITASLPANGNGNPRIVPSGSSIRCSSRQQPLTNQRLYGPQGYRHPDYPGQTLPGTPAQPALYRGYPPYNPQHYTPQHPYAPSFLTGAQYNPTAGPYGSLVGAQYFH